MESGIVTIKIEDYLELIKIEESVRTKTSYVYQYGSNSSIHIFPKNEDVEKTITSMQFDFERRLSKANRDNEYKIQLLSDRNKNSLKQVNDELDKIKDKWWYKLFA